jgi:transcription elongation factor SPT6
MLIFVLLFQDEFSKNVQDWNSVRVECVELALTRLLLPELRKELQTHLLAEAREAVLKTCCRKLYNWLKVSSLFEFSLCNLKHLFCKRFTK